MIKTRFLPLALVLGSFPPIQAQYKVIFNFGAFGDPSCSSNETMSQSPGGNLLSTDHSGCSTGSQNPPAAYEIGFQGAKFTILQEFTAPFASPLSGLTLGTDQRFHGTTNAAGSRNHGTVYRLSPAGAIVYEHDFEGGADGGFPWAAPIQGADGAYYGTTAGASSAYAGTVYKIDTSGRYSVLHLFTTTDGRGPIASLVQGTDLNFYGTTTSGGVNGLGTFFRISSTGVFSVLYNFASTDGASPVVGPLIQSSDGNFYGVTVEGGNTNKGAVLKMTPGGTVTVFYSFLGGQDGSEPGGGLVEATDGNFYGTLNQEGAAGGGTLYRLTPAGVFTKLHDFRVTSGWLPQNTLMQHTSGKLYGTTWAGGANNDGVIFEYDPGLAPFVTFLNVYGQAGAKVDILGQYFASGVTTVYFNGVPALNPEIYSTHIKATVPVGATTGSITVTTSKGTLKSNKPFVVH
jgi:uncharacterized repeat protein (TIGR03803 family)